MKPSSTPERTALVMTAVRAVDRREEQENALLAERRPQSERVPKLRSVCRVATLTTGLPGGVRVYMGEQGRMSESSGVPANARQ